LQVARHQKTENRQHRELKADSIAKPNSSSDPNIRQDILAAYLIWTKILCGHIANELTDILITLSTTIIHPVLNVDMDKTLVIDTAIS